MTGKLNVALTDSSNSFLATARKALATGNRFVGNANCSGHGSARNGLGVRSWREFSELQRRKLTPDKTVVELKSR